MATAFLMRITNPMIRRLEARSKYLEEMVEERTKKLLEAQEQLIRKEKLAVLGQLAGGVGHELRNPLGVMSNAVYYLKMILSDADENTKEYLDILSSEVRNANQIVSDLLDFSRVNSLEREKTAVHDLVFSILSRQPAPENVDVSAMIPPDLPPVFVDSRQIRQVLLNLITNAYDAMPEGGKLTIGAHSENSQVDIFIADTGSGIPKKDLNRVFEPLFTTKARGIGLGLSVSKNLVEANDGRIAVESKQGKGSVFTVVLPTSEVAL